MGCLLSVQAGSEVSEEERDVKDLLEGCRVCLEEAAGGGSRDSNPETLCFAGHAAGPPTRDTGQINRPRGEDDTCQQHKGPTSCSWLWASMA